LEHGNLLLEIGCGVLAVPTSLVVVLAGVLRLAA